MNSIRICEGVAWEAASGENADSYFPEAHLDQLAINGLDSILKKGDVQALLGRLGQPVGTNGQFAVNEVVDAPDVVVKVSNLPFSDTAINIALQEGWRQHPLFSTPQYLGVVVDKQMMNYTVMSRVMGHHISDGLTQKIDGTLPFHVYQAKISNSGQQALRSVGIEPDTAMWDLNTGNIISERGFTNWEEQRRTPVTIIDQMSRPYFNASEWSSTIPGRYYNPVRDFRDVAAENASDKAWNTVGVR